MYVSGVLGVCMCVCLRVRLLYALDAQQTELCLTRSLALFCVPAVLGECWRVPRVATVSTRSRGAHQLLSYAEVGGLYSHIMCTHAHMHTCTRTHVSHANPHTCTQFAHKNTGHIRAHKHNPNLLGWYQNLQKILLECLY